MKTLLVVFFTLISLNSFAFDLCSLQETSQLDGQVITKRSKNHNRFTFAEKNLIHRTIALQSFYEGVSKPEALELFSDKSTDGEIIYYEVNGYELIFVHYYPGDNEYGAFYYGSKLIARVGDSFISCIGE